MREKTEARSPEDSERSLPFFARFLEGQDTTETSFMTLKYPSDRDEIDARLEFTPGNKRIKQETISDGHPKIRSCVEGLSSRVRPAFQPAR